MERIENRMVVDSEWAFLERDMKEVEDVVAEEGYHEMGTNVFVPVNEAYEYAIDRCLNGTEEEQKEFREMLVEWFYSGNWIKEE